MSNYSCSEYLSRKCRASEFSVGDESPSRIADVIKQIKTLLLKDFFRPLKAGFYCLRKFFCMSKIVSAP